MDTVRTIINISSKKYFLGCFFVALGVYVISLFVDIPPIVVAVEVLLTVMGLFIFGSSRYRIDKNVLAYGAALVIFATFFNSWFKGSNLKLAVQTEGMGPLFRFLGINLLTMEGLNKLIHADTLLFILGLTLFVAVIAQTRILEAVSIYVLKGNKGRVVPTVAILTAVVSFASGILDGVSMIGLMIRILVTIMFLAHVKKEIVLYIVMVSTIVTTVCGMWLAYGEPPNLIMKANLHPYLTNAFFLRYCLPVAVGSYLIVAWNLSRKLKGKLIDLPKLDILDLNMADVRFLQAKRHGEVLIPSEFATMHMDSLADHYEPVTALLHKGVPLGLAMVKQGVPKKIRIKLLADFISENLADDLDAHYEKLHNGKIEDSNKLAQEIKKTFRLMRQQKTRAQWIGGFSFIPFVGFLVWHAFDHNVPLFFASFAGFIVSLLGIFYIKKIRRYALKEAVNEYKDYLFLIPLFFSITLLQKTGFFEQIAVALQHGIKQFGMSHMAYAQFTGATFLSAILDNNVVADFTSRALHGLDVGAIYLFAMAQIAGYAVGGCWTHIGSAQSVVAYAFIHRQLDEHYTPMKWIKAMTPIIIEIFLLVTVIVYLESLLFRYLS